nr:uncharacterized protein LOC114827109 [Malus domestica]
MEDPAKARGFLRVRVLVNSENPLVLGCWLKMEVNRETWVEFRYERLQDFCYHCGRIDHINTECSFAANMGGAEGYGDWIKAPPVREFVEHVRPSRLGVGERRLVGMVRGSDRPELRLQRSIHNEAPSRKDTSGVTAGELGSHVRDKKKWRRGEKESIRFGFGMFSEADSGTPPVGDLEGFTGTLASTSRLCSSLLRHEVGGIKRGVEPSSMDLVPSPQKKTRGPNPDADRQVIQDGTMEVSDLAGGLSLWWGDSVEVQSLFSSKHIIDVILRKGGDSNWVRITRVYGTPYREDKAEFWEWMSSHFSPADIPWLFWGVEVLYNRPRYLETFMQVTNLWDLDFNGPAFTWHGMRHGHLVEERIDRALINGLWQDLWPNSLVTHGTVMGSDHCPLIIQTESESMRGRRAFKFEAFWAKEIDCDQVVRSCWNRQAPSEILVRWTKKINDCKSSLIRWSRNKFKKRGLLIQELLHQLQELQMDWRSNIEVIKQKTQLVDELRAQEESYWMQRSRVRWLRDGDANTKFFHNSTLQRRRRNQIIKIKDELGNWVEQPGRVRKLVEYHFIHTFTTGGARNWGSFLDCISPRVTEDMNLALFKPVSEDEIKTAIFKNGWS